MKWVRIMVNGGEVGLDYVRQHYAAVLKALGV